LARGSNRKSKIILAETEMVEISSRDSAQPRGSAARTREPTTLVSRNVIVNGRRTSLRLEPEMWEALDEIAKREAKSINDLVAFVDRNRDAATLTSDVRVFVLSYFRGAATERGHAKAGHGILFAPGVSASNGTGSQGGTTLPVPPDPS
jgi:predicted DNA-binding ribbon-helix-helix protein